ncbi:MAG: SUMF1/EgtB/PvdO family nonheme iron enzyme [bacterium]
MRAGWMPSGDHRVVRGGSWNTNARRVRSANRNHNDPVRRNANIGFRLVRPPSPRPAWPRAGVQPSAPADLAPASW